MTRKKYCVYVHRKQTDGSVFYVGKGTPKRARSMRGRSAYWTRIAEKYGRVVDFVCSGMAEDDAFELERFLIAEIGRDNLCNLTDGGEGASGRVVRPEVKAHMSKLFSGIKPSPKTLAASISKNSVPIGTVCGYRFKSIREAARNLAGNEGEASFCAGVSACLSGKMRTSKGLEWRKVLPCGALVESSFSRTWPRSAVGNDQGLCFYGPGDAAAWLGMPCGSANITQVCKGSSRLLTVGGFKWGYLVNGFPEFLSRERRVRGKPVINSCGFRFNSQADAVKWLVSIGHENSRQSGISAALTGRSKKYKGYDWRFEE